MEVPWLDPLQMRDWRYICQTFAKKINAELLDYNESAMFLQLSDGTFRHIYVDEVKDYLQNDNFIRSVMFIEHGSNQEN